MSDFAIYLKKIRLSEKLTQTQFAAKIGIDCAALSKIENDKKEFDPKKLSTLSEEFNLDINEIKIVYFGEQIALALYEHQCPIDALKVAENKYSYLTGIEFS